MSGRSDERARFLGTLAILGAATTFGTLGVVTRFAYDGGMTVTSLAGWRAAIGAIALAALIAGRGILTGAPILPRGVTRREIGTIAVLSGLGFLVNVGLFTAFGRMSVPLVLFAFYTHPTLIALVGSLQGDPLDRRRLTALGLAVAGTALVILAGLDPAAGVRIDPLGLVLAVGAGAAQATFALVTRPGFRSMPSEHATASLLGGMALIFVVSSLVLEGTGPLALPTVSPQLLLIVAYCGIGTAAVSTFLFISAIRLMGPFRAGIGSLFEPVVGVGLAAVFLGEVIGPVQGLGGLLVLSAAALLQRTPTAARPVTAPEAVTSS